MAAHQGGHFVWVQTQRLENWGARRAAWRPYFLRSFMRGSRVRKPAAFRAELLVHQQEGPGDAVADGAGLAGDAAAGDGGLDVHLADGGGGDQGLTDDELQGLQTEVVLNVPTVDGDGAGAVGEEVDPGHGGLPAAGAVVIGLLTLIHLPYPPYASV